MAHKQNKTADHSEKGYIYSWPFFNVFHLENNCYWFLSPTRSVIGILSIKQTFFHNLIKVIWKKCAKIKMTLKLLYFNDFKWGGKICTITATSMIDICQNATLQLYVLFANDKIIITMAINYWQGVVHILGLKSS